MEKNSGDDREGNKQKGCNHCLGLDKCPVDLRYGLETCDECGKVTNRLDLYTTYRENQ